MKSRIGKLNVARCNVEGLVSPVSVHSDTVIHKTKVGSIGV
jgi:hypothetical protein